MAASINQLNALKVNALKDPGYYHDGGGLYLQVTDRFFKSWILKYHVNGKTREMGLGSMKYISLSEAREKRAQAKKMILDGLDPIEEKKKKKNQLLFIKLNSKTFKECAEKLISERKSTWKNEKHQAQWGNTLSKYAYPIIGNIDVAEINTQMIIKILDPIWYEKTETAQRLRGRIENILSWAKVHGYRAGENPAIWRGHLDQIYKSKSKVRAVNHMSALPYQEISNLMNKLGGINRSSAQALQFLILTATRTNEIIGAKWNEINLQNRIWIIPKERMKAGKEHKIPLSTKAIEVILKLKRNNLSPFVFNSEKKESQLGANSMLDVLKDLKCKVTVHGFRSSFRDWVSEETNYNSDVAEAALAHTIKNKVEAAYRRGDYLSKREILMETWSNYCYASVKGVKQIYG